MTLMHLQSRENTQREKQTNNNMSSISLITKHKDITHKKALEIGAISRPRSMHRAAFGPTSMATAPAPPVGLALPVA